MFSEKINREQVVELEKHFKRELREYSLEESKDLCDRLSGAFGKKGEALRAYTKEEQEFVENELLMTKISFKYWCNRYCRINVAGQGISTMHPLLETQEFVIRRLGKREEEIADGAPGGIFVNFLKGARQVGGSTLAEAIICHRATTQGNLQGIMASHEPGPKGSGYLFGMFEQMYDNLPQWLKPEALERVKDTEISFAGGTHLWIESGKAMKGTKGQRGQIGRGMTISTAHLSELSSWEFPDQIDGSLLPTMPRTARTFVFFESTAKGRGNNWWHRWWRHAPGTIWKFQNIFIPWYVEQKYSERAPEGWIPAAATLAHGKRIEETSARWVGSQVTPTKDQLYWYELTRSSYEQNDKLKTFLEEFGAIDDDECFQFTGRSIFSASTIQRMQDQAKPIQAVIEIRPNREMVR